MKETPLKGKGGFLQAGWESWRTTAGVHRTADTDRDPLFSPLSAARSKESTDTADSGRGDEEGASRKNVKHRKDAFEVPVLPPSKRVDSFLAFFSRELQWGHAQTWRSRSDASEHVMNFFRVTLSLEPFLNFGHLLCIDLFLFHFTLLPLRCISALWRFVVAVAGAVSQRLRLLRDGEGKKIGWRGFTQAHAYDLIKGAIFITATSALGAVQVSRVYHYIRGEAIIKLYVIFNILEIFDKLACSLGQDVMDGLYRTTRDRLSLVLVREEGKDSAARRRRALFQLFFHFSVAVLYVVAHAVILFVQIVCLNVAINSRNNALFTLLISNNFMELKASVFKKFEAENLFQVACSDAVERFQLILFLILIGIQELTSLSAASALLPSMLAILACEVLVDYVKHAFISKFNRLHSDLYQTFTAILAHDLLAVRARMPFSLDPTHSGVKRLGLATLPLAVVAHRMLLLRFWPDLPGRVVESPMEDSSTLSAGPGETVVELVTESLGSTNVGGGGVGGGGLGVPSAFSWWFLPLSSLQASLIPSVSLPSLHTVFVGLLFFCVILAIKFALNMLLLSSAATTVLEQKRESVVQGPLTSTLPQQAQEKPQTVPKTIHAVKPPKAPPRPTVDGPISFFPESPDKNASSPPSVHAGEDAWDDDYSVDSADSMRPDCSTGDFMFGKGALEKLSLERLITTSRYTQVKGRIPI